MIRKLSTRAKHTKTSIGGVIPFTSRVKYWFCTLLVNCGFGILLVWSKFTRNDEFFAQFELVMTPIGSVFTVWKHFENVTVWFACYQMTFQIFYIIQCIFFYNELLTQCWLNADYRLTNYWLNIDQNILTSKIWPQLTYYVWNIHNFIVKYIHSCNIS